jgi:hypothetical protein
VVAAVAVAVVLSSAGGVLAKPQAKPKPTADVVFKQTVHVVGSHFKPKEHVTVTIVATDVTWKRKLQAKPTGAFDVDFGHIPLNACNGYTLKVVGALGSHTGLSHPVEPC